MSTKTTNTKEDTDLKLIKCAITDKELIESFENYTYDKNYNEKMLIKVALGKFLEEEGYL